MSLNERQRRFADEYLVDCNATQAATRAGYSAATAYSQGQRLLKHVEVAAHLRERKAELDAAYEHRIMGKYEVLARLTEIAKGDIGDLLADGDDLENLSVKQAKDLGKSHLVKKAKVTTTVYSREDGDVQTTTAELELYSAHEALRDLGKHHILFTDKTEISIKPEDLAKLSDDELAKIARGGK